MSELHLEIDWTRCDAHGLCVELLPEVLELDDWGYPIQVTGGAVPPGLRDYAEHAVRVCPNLALRLRPREVRPDSRAC